MRKMQIKLPWLDMSLMPNRKNGRHWGSTQAAKVKARDGAYWAAKQEIEPGVKLAGPLHLSITYFAPDGRHRDLDNLLAASKAAIDGIAQAIGVDDKCFRPITIDTCRDSNKKGFVMVEVGHD